MKYEFMQELLIDKSDWKPVKFGDVVFEPKESVKDLGAAGIQHVVGLEHIDSEDIHLRRSAGIEDETTFTKKFSKDDVLFGRRRAYLKKAAYADYDGVCSGDIIVMRAKQELLMPELLPFLVNNDSFFDYAIQHSAGGLSPRVKFKDLANYELLLPPKDQQAEIAELFWAMDDVVERKVIVLKEISTLRASVEKEFFLENELKPSIPSKEFFDSVRDGTHDTPRKQADGFRLLTSKNIVNNQLSLETDYFISLEDYKVVNKRSKVERNDILFGMIGTVGQVCRVLEEPNYAIKNMGLFKVRDEYKSRLAFHYFRSSFFQSALQRTLSGTTQKYVSLGQLRQISLPNPNSLMVKKWVKKEEHFDLLQSDCLKAISSSKSLQKSLINQVF